MISRRHTDIYEEVDAELVGGPEGVFAVWAEVYDKKHATIHFASGDDGFWWEDHRFSSHYIDEIINAIVKVKDSL